MKTINELQNESFVMMYHGFPRASQAEKLEKLEPLSPSLSGPHLEINGYVRNVTFE